MVDTIGTVFISHRSSDAAIGRVLATFLREESGNRVTVFFSSDSQFVTPRGGRILDDELIEAIGESGVLILLYTGMSQQVDWAYCIYEAAYAKSKGIPVYVFQCQDEAPAPLRHLVRFKVSNKEDLTKFVIDFLTTDDFFPSQRERVTNFSQEDPAVFKKAEDLSQQLSAEVVKLSKSAKEWTPWPFLRIKAHESDASRITESGRDFKERCAATEECLANRALVVDSKAVDRIFGIGVDDQEGFARLVSSWEDSCEQQADQWLGSLIDQMAAAANRMFHPLRDIEIREAMGRSNRIPVVTRTLSYPDGSMEFEVLFFDMAPRTSLVGDIMTARENMYLRILADEPHESWLITEIFEEMRRQRRHRLPVLNSSGAIVYMVHRSMISEFLAQCALQGKAANELTFQDMLNHPDMKSMFETTFVFVRRDTTADEVRRMLKEHEGARDVFVTENGRNDEPILGMLTTSDVVERM